jgi:hypothetical protein
VILAAELGGDVEGVGAVEVDVVMLGLSGFDDKEQQASANLGIVWNSASSVSPNLGNRWCDAVEVRSRRAAYFFAIVYADVISDRNDPASVEQPYEWVRHTRAKVLADCLVDVTANESCHRRIFHRTYI